MFENPAVQNEVAFACGHQDFVPVDDLALSLFNDVGMGLEDRQHLVGSRDLLAFDHAPLGLFDYALDERQEMFERRGTVCRDKHLIEVVAHLGAEQLEGALPVTLDLARGRDKFAVQRFASLRPAAAEEPSPLSSPKGRELLLGS